MRVRRLRKEPAHLEITAFINLIVVLVPFLLSTAVFTRLTVIDLSLPAQSAEALEKLEADKLQLEVVLRPDALEVGDRIGGLIARLPATPQGRPDTPALQALAAQIKSRFPNQKDASVLAEPDIPYDSLVQVMDALRRGHDKAELFSQISVGDAPVVAAAGRKP